MQLALLLLSVLFRPFSAVAQQSIVYQYDNNSQLTTVSYSNGLVVHYSYDALGNRLTKSSTIQLPQAAAGITGTSVVCKGTAGVVYSVPVITNAAWYIWSVPAGASIVAGDSTRTITVNYSMAAQSGNVTVYGKNAGGSGTASPVFAVTVNSIPGAAGTISGPTQVQPGQSGVICSVAPVTGATGYAWTLPAGTTITSGAGTNTITLLFSNAATGGSVTVRGTNTCGGGMVSPGLQVAVSAGVPPIVAVGNEIIPPGQTDCYNATQTLTLAGNGSTFTVQAGASATVVAGQNIRFLPGSQVYSGGYLHGYITSNSAYCTPASKTLQNVAVTAGQVTCFGATQTITLAGSGTTFTVQNGGSVNLIAGQNIQFLPGAAVSNGGYLDGRISTNGQYCGTLKSIPEVAFSTPFADTLSSMKQTARTWFRVFPNPTTGEIHIQMEDPGDPGIPVQVATYNLVGKMTGRFESTGQRTFTISLGNCPVGLYQLRVRSGNRTGTVKIIKL
ncbi:MAG: T9SS type A sorting domain-containing protein [Bacteroidetes bacterium]|nr:T9SS type A sorting domain-containing protein [Bacteroidota bacterium]